MGNSVSYKQVNMVNFCILAVLVGIITGFGSLIFRFLISFVYNLMFLGEFSFHHASNELSTVGMWGALVVFVPVVGGIIAVWLLTTFAPDAKGHGVPEVMHAIYYKEGVMRPVVAVIKSLASAVSIGSGASVGREGPIIQIGASLGSTVGQVFKLVPWQRTTLLAAGGGAGLAATFNSPLGGVMFAMEVMMLEVSNRTFLPIVLATGTATYIGRLFFGLQPAFLVPTASIPSSVPIDIFPLMCFVVLGCICGIVSWLFIDTLTFMEENFKKIHKNEYVRQVIGMLFVGISMYVLFVNYGHYFIDGAGDETMQAILQGNINTVSLLLILFVMKLLATTISLASGASGGVFSPALFMGACVGGAFGGLLNMMFPEYGFSTIEFGMVGMASVVGGTTGAAITAIVMIFEMTRDYNVIIPLIVSVALAIGVRRVLRQENIYTFKLLLSGFKIPENRYINLFLVRHAKDVMETSLCTMSEDTTLDAMLHELSKAKRKKHVLVTRDDKVVGSIPITHVMRAAGGVTSAIKLHDVMIEHYIKVNPDDIFHDIMKKLRHKSGNVAIVVKDAGKPLTKENILGIISKDRIIDSILGYFN